MNPEEGAYVKEAFMVASVISAILFLGLFIVNNEVFYLLGSMLIFFLFLNLSVWAFNTRPKTEGKTFNLPTTINFGSLIGGSFVYFEIMFMALINSFFDSTEMNPNTLPFPSEVFFIMFSVANAFAYYRLVRFSLPKKRLIEIEDN